MKTCVENKNNLRNVYLQALRIYEICVVYEINSGVPRNFVRGVLQIQLRTEEDIENGDLGTVAP